jgi:outer membrane protein assembly factor BamD (BamD/ComL family)
VRSPTVSAPAAAPAPAAAARASDLRDESRLLERARDALRGGDARAALTILDDARARFPNGVLDQERETLSIEAIAASGDRARAAARADAFERRYPNSPLVPRVHRFGSDP